MVEVENLQADLDHWRTIAEGMAKALDDFARGPHRRQFPHVIPTEREAAADVLRAAYDKAVKPKPDAKSATAG